MAEQDPGLEPAEAAPETQPTPDEGDTASPEEKPARSYTQAELDDIVSKVKASQRAKAYRQQQKLKAQLENAVPQALYEFTGLEQDAPKRKEEESYEDYVARRAEWAAERAAHRALDDADERRREWAEAKTQKEIEANWDKSKAVGVKKYADFEEATSRDDVMISVAMARAIKESQVGHDIAYYLAKHPDEAEDIAGMSVSGQIRAVGRLEERLSESKASTKHPAAPIRPVEGRAPANSLELNRNLDQEEWNRRWDLRQAQRARERAGR